MPIYVFRCPECGEFDHSVQDESPDDLPRCFHWDDDDTPRLVDMERVPTSGEGWTEKGVQNG